MSFSPSTEIDGFPDIRLYDKMDSEILGSPTYECAHGPSTLRGFHDNFSRKKKLVRPQARILMHLRISLTKLISRENNDMFKIPMEKKISTSIGLMSSSFRNAESVGAQIEHNTKPCTFPALALRSAAEICLLCENVFTEDMPQTQTSCCYMPVHELCLDDAMESSTQCWSCNSEPRTTDSSKFLVVSDTGDYVHHFVSKANADSGELENSHSEQ